MEHVLRAQSRSNLVDLAVDTMGIVSIREQPMWLSYYGYVCDLYCIQCMIWEWKWTTRKGIEFVCLMSIDVNEVFGTSTACDGPKWIG